VGTRAVLVAVVKRNIPSPRRESNPRTPIIQPVDQRCQGVQKFNVATIKCGCYLSREVER